MLLETIEDLNQTVNQAVNQAVTCPELDTKVIKNSTTP